MKKINFLNIQHLYQKHTKEFNDAYFKVMNSGVYIKGPELELFEKEFAFHSGGEYCVGVGNGLDALVLTLKALGIKKGDEVIVPSFTFIATWFAVSTLGANPIPVDIDPFTYNVDVTKIEENITPKTKAILAVYLYGLPCEIDPIRDIARRYNLYFIADAAQSHGALYKKNKIGQLADATCYSFYPGKNLGAIGDGGAVVTNNRELSEKIRNLGNNGSHKKYYHDRIGSNSRLDEIQAAFLRIKLKYLDQWNQHRNHQAQIYNQLLNKSHIKLQRIPSDCFSVYHLFVISSNIRDDLYSQLLSWGVETLIHYPVPIHKSKAYSKHKINPKNVVIAEQAASSVLSLPIGPHLNDQEVIKISNLVNKIIDKLLCK